MIAIQLHERELNRQSHAKSGHHDEGKFPLAGFSVNAR
jgi:hypothetical protein